MKNIVTTYVCPPIPFRNMDWSAHIDGQEGGIYGHGKTEKEAINDLLELIEE